MAARGTSSHLVAPQHTSWHCAAPCDTVVLCSVPYLMAPCCTAWQHTAPHCTLWHCPALHGSTWHCTTPRGTTLHLVTLCCTASLHCPTPHPVQCPAAGGAALHPVAPRSSELLHLHAVRHAAPPPAPDSSMPPAPDKPCMKPLRAAGSRRCQVPPSAPRTWWPRAGTGTAQSCGERGRAARALAPRINSAPGST